MTTFSTKAALGAAILVGLAGGATAQSNEAFPAARMAQVIAVYHNDSEPKPSSTEALTYARMDMIRASFDVYLDQTPEVDALSPAVMARIESQFDDYIGAPAPSTLLFAKTPVSE